MHSSALLVKQWKTRSCERDSHAGHLVFAVELNWCPTALMNGYLMISQRCSAEWKMCKSLQCCSSCVQRQRSTLLLNTFLSLFLSFYLLLLCNPLKACSGINVVKSNKLEEKAFICHVYCIVYTEEKLLLTYSSLF